MTSESTGAANSSFHSSTRTLHFNASRGTFRSPVCSKDLTAHADFHSDFGCLVKKRKKTVNWKPDKPVKSSLEHIDKKERTNVGKQRRTKSKTKCLQFKTQAILKPALNSRRHNNNKVKQKNRVERKKYEVKCFKYSISTSADRCKVQDTLGCRGFLPADTHVFVGGSVRPLHSGAAHIPDSAL